MLTLTELKALRDERDTGEGGREVVKAASSDLLDQLIQQTEWLEEVKGKIEKMKHKNLERWKKRIPTHLDDVATAHVGGFDGAFGIILSLLNRE